MLASLSLWHPSVERRSETGRQERRGTMDGDRFDHWSRVFGAVRSRRAVMALALALESGGLLALLGGEPARAKKKCKPKCPVCKKCKDGKCKNKRGGRCGADGTCKKGTCVCNETCPQCTTCANGACVNDNGAACGLNRSCQGGACVCEADSWECEAGHCCPRGRTCSPSAATCPTCPPVNSCDDVVLCGYVQDQQASCTCVTSRSNKTTCSSLIGQCFACDEDADCEGVLGDGVPAVCAGGPCVDCPGDVLTLCVPDGCFDPNAAGSGTRGRAALTRMRTKGQ
jgi:hypothetical protein